jgi:hypothetical protein
MASEKNIVKLLSFFPHHSLLDTKEEGFHMTIRQKHNKFHLENDIFCVSAQEEKLHVASTKKKSC